MKTVGEIIKESRLKKKISLDKLERKTKIKKEFIGAIEKGDWDLLPEYPVVLGFVKSISASLSLNEKTTLAVLRRDYPPKAISINPKPDISKKFTLSPRLSFFIGIAFILILIFSYLSYQYIRFISPPLLEITAPLENAVILEREVSVEGKTDTDATVLVNNQSALVNDDGFFQTRIEVNEDTEELEVVAKSRGGKVTTVTHKIKVEINSE